MSRELLQESRDVKAIREGSTKRVLGMLEALADSEDAAEKAKYAAFWKDFGAVLKEGVGEDHANHERLCKLLRFASTHADEGVSLTDYVGRMKEGQEAIYVITADSLAAAKSSPQLEIFRKKGIEVLLLTDRVDEWMLSHLYEFDGHPLQSVAKGAVDLGKLQDEAEKKQAEEATTAIKPVLDRLKETLKDRAKDVRVTTRLVDSPACLVVEEGDMSGHLARMLKQAGQTAPKGAADSRDQRRARTRQAPGDERAFRRPGEHPVRPGGVGRRRAILTIPRRMCAGSIRSCWRSRASGAGRPARSLLRLGSADRRLAAGSGRGWFELLPWSLYSAQDQRRFGHRCDLLAQTHGLVCPVS